MKKHSIIVIDDESTILSSVKTQLRNHFGTQFEIESALSAADGLELIKEITEKGDDVPVVICDYLMPGMKGDRMIIELYKHYPNTLSILLTGHVDVEAMGNIINSARLFRYMPKPWEEIDMILTVREAINYYELAVVVKTQNKQITQYAFSNAHRVRGPLARILGIINLMKFEPDLIIENNLIEKLETSAVELNQVVEEINKSLEGK